jgi:hypothetical protein
VVVENLQFLSHSSWPFLDQKSHHSPSSITLFPHVDTLTDAGGKKVVGGGCSFVGVYFAVQSFPASPLQFHI